ncbi:hypothetical protein [Pleionea mediterranea]|uniref:Uncharacterized protein n=1 Tax=Pleionea mediterranea TaxID=523701 RepID=A0A316F9K5_9GAMM|nr:hypothetical protein [Pleionea mediterranea]PWK44435.1 hypothetical protein C8D97_11537 [Pleionea mediterranea]
MIFKWVWRINGILIFLSASVLIFMMGKEMIRDIVKNRPQQKLITNVAEDPKGEEKWILGYMRRFDNSNYIAVPLVSDKDETTKISLSKVNHFSGSYGGYGTYKNILFVNGKTNQSRWLFDNNDQLIIEFSEFPQNSLIKGDNSIATVVTYEVVSNDTNKDGALSKKDRRQLAVSNTNGDNYNVVLEDFDHLVGMEVVDDENMLILYQIKGVGYSMVVRLSDVHVVSTNRLPKISI